MTAGYTTTVYRVGRKRLHYFPIIASAAWFLTLTTLLIRWLSLGRPRYPGQVNPLIPFISDIAAFRFKPVFVAGCTITAICFVGTVFSVHHVRYSTGFYGLADDAAWRKTLSFIAMFTGFVSGACLFLLSVFDTFQKHEEHRYLLVGLFGGLALSSITTEIVWWDETYKAARFPGLRKWYVRMLSMVNKATMLTLSTCFRCIVNNFLVLCITGFGVAFLVLLYTDYWHSAALMEWIITYLGSIWIGTFAGYIRYVHTESSNPSRLLLTTLYRFREAGGVANRETSPEHQPLLAPV